MNFLYTRQLVLRLPDRHDALFVDTFTQTEQAASLLDAVLPGELLVHVDLASIKLEPGHLVDEKREGLRDRPALPLSDARGAGRGVSLRLAGAPEQR